ncbi:hypothetical protein KP509_03G003700 [Ceratopteris richardii]|uniref:Uncharacterized protein n=1 Tax=Ceratopteris richardii TaxID=49495 RepID=A0A8T2V4J8_CERRI|nr:hypothetical protein KP509_03G003700 [Ceratopteris richardii]
MHHTHMLVLSRHIHTYIIHGTPCLWTIIRWGFTAYAQCMHCPAMWHVHLLHLFFSITLTSHTHIHTSSLQSSWMLRSPFDLLKIYTQLIHLVKHPDWEPNSLWCWSSSTCCSYARDAAQDVSRDTHPQPGARTHIHRYMHTYTCMNPHTFDSTSRPAFDAIENEMSELLLPCFCSLYPLSSQSSGFVT